MGMLMTKMIDGNDDDGSVDRRGVMMAAAVICYAPVICQTPSRVFSIHYLT